MTVRDTLYDKVGDLERRIGVPEGFLNGLLEEDDWSFLIKAHAFLEAVVSHLITEATDSRLEDVFGRMQLGGGKTGKLAFLKALGLLSEESRQIIERVSALRNGAVHRIQNVNFSFAEHIRSLTPGERRNEIAIFLGSFSSYVGHLAANDGAVFARYAKELIHFALAAVVVEAYYALNPGAGDFAAELSVLAGAFGIFLIILAEEETGPTG